RIRRIDPKRAYPSFLTSLWKFLRGLFKPDGSPGAGISTGGFNLTSRLRDFALSITFVHSESVRKLCDLRKKIVYERLEKRLNRYRVVLHPPHRAQKQHFKYYERRPKPLGEAVLPFCHVSPPAEA